MFLLVEYNRKNFKKIWRLPSTPAPLSVGHSRLAKINLDSSHDGIEGVFEFLQGRWQFTYLTQASENPINRLIPIQGYTVIPLNVGELKVTPFKKDINLFDKSKESNKKGQGHEKLWLVWKRNETVWYSEFLEPQQRVRWPHNEQALSLSPTHQWQSVFSENFELQFKLAQEPSLDAFRKGSWEGLLDPQFRPYMLSAFVLSFLLGGLSFFPSKESPLVSATRIAIPTESTVIRLDKKALPPSKNPVAKAIAQATPPTNQNAQGSIARRSLSRVFSQISKRSVASINLGAKTITLSQNVQAIPNSESAKTFKMLGTIGTGTGLSGGVVRGLAGTGSSATGTSGLGGPIGGGQLGAMNQGSIGTPDLGLMHKEADVSGGLDREVIAKYIQSQKGKILYCYQRQLSANPGLFGKIAIRFEIAANGKVDTSKIVESTLSNQNVENCLLSLMTTWKFPDPKGGVRVLVNYPFVFKSLN